MPGFESAAAPFVTISTRLEDMTGRVDVISALPAGLPLHAHRVEILPPIEGVFALGGERVAAWLRANGWERTQRCGPGFPDRALVEAYERVWFEEYPVYGGHPDAWAMLGGWHLPGADDDWYDLVPQRLIALTLRDSEPWAEAWQRPDGGLHVIQRITWPRTADSGARPPRPRLPTVLLQHPHVRDHHAAVDGLDHVVDGQQPHLDGREGLHLDAGVPGKVLRFVCILLRLPRASGHLGWTKFGQRFAASSQNSRPIVGAADGRSKYHATP